MNARRLTICVLGLIVLAAPITPAAAPNTPQQNGFLSIKTAEILAAHNMVRSKVGVAPLVWSDELAQIAQEWANSLIATGNFEHRRDAQYGENIFEISGFRAFSTPGQVVNAWAAESVSYRYETNTCTGMCGHYTQIIWRQTKEVGCGVARDAGREIWVCNYAPFGNVFGERPY